MRTDSTDSGSSLREERQSRENALHSIDSVRQLLNVTREFLTQRQGSSVLSHRMSNRTTANPTDEPGDEFDRF